jgi:hypothetical protein
MTLSPMDPNVNNNCGIGSQRYTGLLDCVISAQVQHTKKSVSGPSQASGQSVVGIIQYR